MSTRIWTLSVFAGLEGVQHMLYAHVGQTGQYGYTITTRHTRWRGPNTVESVPPLHYLNAVYVSIGMDAAVSVKLRMSCVVFNPLWSRVGTSKYRRLLDLSFLESVETH